MAGGGDVVLLAVDPSEQAEHAFDWYMTHLHRKGNKLVLVHGMELPSVPTRESWDSQHNESSKKKQQLEDKYQKKFEKHGVIGRFVSDIEKPGELICETARQEKASYIVMGTRGMGKLRRTIMGSVSDYVVHHSSCPVVVCRQ